jgi:hypothetical protein
MRSHLTLPSPRRAAASFNKITAANAGLPLPRPGMAVVSRKPPPRTAAPFVSRLDLPRSLLASAARAGHYAVKPDGRALRIHGFDARTIPGACAIAGRSCRPRLVFPLNPRGAGTRPPRTIRTHALGGVLAAPRTRPPSPLSDVRLPVNPSTTLQRFQARCQAGKNGTRPESFRGSCRRTFTRVPVCLLGQRH